MMLADASEVGNRNAFYFVKFFSFRLLLSARSVL
jgi:hypothetical protein